RYADASLLHADLARLAARAPIDTIEGAAATAASPATAVRGSEPAGDPTPGRSPRRGRRSELIAATVVLVLVTGGLTWFLLRDDGGECCGADPAIETVRGDIDGDGHGDLTLLQDRSGSARHLATWTVPSNGKSFGTPVEGETADGVLLLGDVDGDGRTDQVWGDAYVSSERTAVALTIRPGDEERAEQTVQVPIEPDVIDFFSTAVLDLDHDGRDDLATYQVDNQSNRASVWAVLATDDGFGEAQQWYAGDADYGSDVVAGDFDGDGNDELIEVLAHDDDLAAYDLRLLTPAEDSSDGAGDLVPGETTTIRGRTLGLSGSYAADTDGDGADDLVIPGAGGQRILAAKVVDGVVEKPQVAWEITQRESTEKYRANLFQNGSSSWAVADLDGDGDDDLVHVDDVEGEDPDRASSFGLSVFTADGGRYEGPQPWGRFPCASECGDDFKVIASAR
ncbi:MAG: VCBS repeat-containing protein, partial [Nocardioidaceae bacterium]|nr:VCBS repeat-containing protein [Nocardioidaceae bacterium]